MADVRQFTVASTDTTGEGIHLILRGGRIFKPANGDPNVVDEILLPAVCGVIVVPEQQVVDVVKHIGVGIPAKIVGLIKSLFHL